MAVMFVVEVSVAIEPALEVELVAVADPRGPEFDSAQVSKSELFVEDVVEKQVFVPIVAVVGTGLAPKDGWDAALMLWVEVVVDSVETM